MTLDKKFLETVWQWKPKYVIMPYWLWSCKAECFIPATRAVSQGSYSVLAARLAGIFIVRVVLFLFNIKLRNFVCILNKSFEIYGIYACVTKHGVRVRSCGM